uniref:Spatacsin-like n=1 Tax=Saccoglossus kowalevskii TaxID=10224 RepID=A0ABM0LV81_SACKO|nr:PREDICTED: spatacsin-like [Saccoglossus kowalevskii]
MHKTDDSTTLVSSDTGSDIPPSDLEARYVAKDLFSIMFTCHNYSHPWRSLLAHSVVLSQPVLAILAACYKEAVMLDCLCVWLLVSMDEVSVAKVAKANDMTTVQWHKWDLGDFSQILDIIVEKGYLSMLVKGFQIFDKDCSLFAFVQFLEAFLVGHDTEKCKKCLKEFYDALLLLSADLSSVQQSGVWQSSEGREAFWYKCHEVFQLHQTSSDFAAQFFKDHAESSSMCVKEKELLLGLAHHWLAKDLMHVQREELQKLEQQIWLCRIQIEVYNAETPSPEDEVMTTNSKEMFKLPLNKKIKPEFGHLGNKELLLEEIYTISKETVPILTALKEKQALDRLIGAQLEAHCISQALSLAKQFKHYNENLAVVMTCLQLAQGRLNTDELDTTMNELLIKGKGRRKSSPWAGTMSRSASFASLSSAQTEYLSRDAEDLVNTMETLSENCKLGKKCCYRIINCFSIGQILNRSYVDIVNQNCFDVLKDVLTSDHMHRFQLAKTYIASSGATDQELAGFLSDAITHSLSVFTGHQDGDMPCQSRDLIFSPMDKKEDFANLLSLCDNPAVLGYRLADTAAYLASSFPEDPNKVLAMEVELLVRSHQCHTLCCNMEGIASILRTCRVRSIKLASVEEYPLLVRMLTGVGRYSEMTYIIDIIIKAQRFELLFIKGKKDDKLKVALLDYLKKYYPDDKDIFTMMALKFNMYREIAELLQSDAKRFLKELKEQFKNMEANPDLQEKLQRILNLFSDAADSYVKEGCLRHAESCVKKARLIALQIHLLSTRTKVINLSQREVVFFVATHPKFYEHIDDVSTIITVNCCSVLMMLALINYQSTAAAYW